MLQFLTVQLVEPRPVPLLAIHTTAFGPVVLLFVIVMSREDVPLFEPSMMIQLAPFSLKIEVELPTEVLIERPIGKAAAVNATLVGCAANVPELIPTLTAGDVS